MLQTDLRNDYVHNDLSNLGTVNQNDADKDEQQMFSIEDLKDMMKREEELKSEAVLNERKIHKLEQQISALQTDLEMKDTEIKSQKEVSLRTMQDLEAKIAEMIEHEATLKEEMLNLRMTINKMEIKQKEQHKKLKRYKHKEQEIQSDIAKIQQWNKKMDENSLQYLGQKFPDSSNKKLFEDCQKGCICLLEESYQAFECKDEEEDHGDEDGQKKHRKKSKLCREMMLCYIEVFRKYIKTTINYASLQQAHNGVVDDLNMLREDVKDYDGGSNLNDDALIMASMTASFF